MYPMNNLIKIIVAGVNKGHTWPSPTGLSWFAFRDSDSASARFENIADATKWITS